MALTALERKAGRHYRNARLAAYSPSSQAYCSVYIDWYRHECPARNGASIAIKLHEQYETSPEYRQCSCGDVRPVLFLGEAHQECGTSELVTPEGFFAFIWKQGRCADCELTVASKDARVVLTSERPAMETRRVAGG